MVGVALLAMSQTLYLHPHYFAPLTGLMWFLTIVGARAFASWKLGATRRPWIACALLLVAALAPTAGAMKRGPWRPRRSLVESQVAAEAGRQLVIVHFGADIDFHESWIYNAADVDTSQVVWARSLGQDADDRLLRYYADRHAWHLFVDRKSIHLVPIDRYQSPAVPHGELAARPSGVERGVTRPSAN